MRIGRIGSRIRINGRPIQSEEPDASNILYPDVKFDHIVFTDSWIAEAKVYDYNTHYNPMSPELEQYLGRSTGTSVSKPLITPKLIEEMLKNVGSSSAPQPRSSRFLSKLADLLPSELKDYEEEFQQFTEDGLADRIATGQSTKLFIVSEAYSRAVYILKTKLFFLRDFRCRSVH